MRDAQSKGDIATAPLEEFISHLPRMFWRRSELWSLLSLCQTWLTLYGWQMPRSELEQERLLET